MEIPFNISEDLKEGHRAFCENRDIEAAIQYWLET